MVWRPWVAFTEANLNRYRHVRSYRPLVRLCLIMLSVPWVGVGYMLHPYQVLWLGDRDSNPNCVIQSHVFCRLNYPPLLRTTGVIYHKSSGNAKFLPR